MKKFTIALASAASLAIAACSPADETTVDDDTAMADEGTNADTGPGTIVDVASNNEDFSTLVTAVTTAELGETLSGEGPFTVFAPNNGAFDAVPEDTMTTLLSEEGREQLTSILTYHVVEGETMAADLVSAIEGAGEEGYSIPTVGGGTLTAMMGDNGPTLTDAAGNTVNIVSTDVDASNGVIHVIDGVLMPE
ncbi:fasciclin domain-containing protein [Aurantiacibacter gangjinensis]|uniref:Beta-Ig-H3/fasciclin n=1 Tax=Aurantiacibacter gangjinensis TaxID=502682 RepID=A0A0G9MMH1_9SPHN|nr:fasciclin domain-containing protein [Aurantiacibacter gangjinensis]APE27992.1 Secreted and surface protein containing fasciclin-like repeats [Aurantiacibacter gangjinensis]KLE31931.1 beta-Ig-H3/fasciclin [Aurantiacibacter gangjinensis]